MFSIAVCFNEVGSVHGASVLSFPHTFSRYDLMVALQRCGNRGCTLTTSIYIVSNSALEEIAKKVGHASINAEVHAVTCWAGRKDSQYQRAGRTWLARAGDCDALSDSSRKNLQPYSQPKYISLFLPTVTPG
jgi:hypothetical protein